MSQCSRDMPLAIVAYQDVYQWVVMQREGLGDAYREQSAVVRLSPADLVKLGVGDGGLVGLRSEAGAVVVRAKPDADCEEGTGYIPVSLYSNYLASYDPSRSRLPNLRHIEVMASPAETDVTPLSDLLVRKTVA